MNLTKKELFELERLQITGYNTGGKLYINEDTIIKIQNLNDGWTTLHRESNINKLLTMPTIPYSSYPSEKVYVDNIYAGYVMPYLKNTKSFKYGIFDKKLTTEDRINIINHVIKTLRQFHNLNIVFGDIHMHNYLYDYNNNAYIIDLDDVTINNNKQLINQLYYLHHSFDDPCHTLVDRSSDNIKAIISFASFLFSIDLQSIANYGCIDEVQELLNESIDNLKLKEYFNTVLSDFNRKPIYFNEAMQFLEDPEIVKKYSKTLNENFANSR